MYSWGRWLNLGLTALLLAGCSSSGPPTYDVSGAVTWNGNPLPQGDILFVPLDGNGVPDAGKIVDGKYGLRVKAGRKKVEIHASREGKFDPVEKARAREAFIPKWYNANSILKAEVKPDGENRFDFPLSESTRPPDRR
jgi:hypothetical protein